MENQTKQQQESSKEKNVQLEGQLLIRQLKQSISRKKYHETIAKTERFIQKQSDYLLSICASIFVKILLLENKALKKLLQKNVYKKYSYELNQIYLLIKIINRNNHLISQMFSKKIQSKQIFDSRQKFLSSDINNHANVFKNEISKSEFANLTKNFGQIYATSVIYIMVTFLRYQFKIQNLQNCLQLMQKLSRSFKKLTIKSKLSGIKLKMLVTRIILQNQFSIHAQKLANNNIQQLISIFYQLKIRIQNLQQSDSYSFNQKKVKILKLKYYLKKTSKLLLISATLLIRINMKAKNQNLVIQAIHIFNFLIENIQGDLTDFKKYLNPQIYIYQQFFQYRAQKFQLQIIIQPIFAQIVHQIRNTTRQESDTQLSHSKKKIIQFYNQKMSDYHQKSLKQEKKSQLKKIKKIDTIKQNDQNDQMCNKIKKIRQTKKSRQTKNKNLCFSIQSSESFFNSSQGDRNISQKRRSVLNNYLNFQNMLTSQLNSSNLAFYTQRSKQNYGLSKQGFNNQSETQRLSSNNNIGLNLFQPQKCGQSIFSYSKNQLVNNYIMNRNSKVKQKSALPMRIIKNRKAIIQNKILNQPQQTILEVAQKIKIQDKLLQTDLKRNITLLKQKKQSRLTKLKTLFKDPYLNQQTQTKFNKQDQIITNLQNRFQNIQDVHSTSQRQKKPNLQSANNNNSSLVNIGGKMQDKMIYISKKSKLKCFIELLIKNKQYLSIKKWSEKVQYLTKKEQLKQKKRVTRKTTSITYNKVRGMPHNLSMLAQDILRFTLQQVQYGVNPRNKQSQQIKNLSIDNTNNYELGQKSIETLMIKLDKEKQEIIRNQQERKKKPITHRKYQSTHQLARNNSKNKWFCHFVL